MPPMTTTEGLKDAIFFVNTKEKCPREQRRHTSCQVCAACLGGRRGGRWCGVRLRVGGD